MAYFVSDAMYNGYEENYLEHYGKKGMKWGKHIFAKEKGTSKAGLRSESKHLVKSIKKTEADNAKSSRSRDSLGEMRTTVQLLNKSDQVRAQAKADAEKYETKLAKNRAKQQELVNAGKNVSTHLKNKEAKLALKQANNKRLQITAEHYIGRQVDYLTKNGYNVHSENTQRGIVSARHTAAVVGGWAVAGVLGGVAGHIIANNNRKQVSGTVYSISKGDTTVSGR